MTTRWTKEHEKAFQEMAARRAVDNKPVWAVISTDHATIKTYTQIEIDAMQGDEQMDLTADGSTSVSVKYLTESTRSECSKIELSVDCYYSSGGEFILQITNTLDVALKVMAAALKADSELN